MITTSYSCSQAELYELCRKGWQLCDDNLAVFTAYKPKYVQTLINDCLTAINTAELMDDSKARYARAQNLRLDLVDKKDDVLDCFQHLKGYIEDAYRGEKVKTMISAAGQQYYTKVSSCSWVNVTAMLNAMGPFVTNNLSDLTADNNMPADFGTRITTLKSEFDALYKSWSEADVAASNDTDAKITINNTLDSLLKTMLSDAQKVFRKDAVMAEKFSVSDLMTQVRGTRPSGINGKTINSVNKMAIVNAQITIVELGIVLKSDENGLFKLTPMALGKYTVIIEAAGFETVTLTKYEIKLSVMNRLIVKMKGVERLVAA